MFGAVPIDSFDVEEKEAFGLGWIVWLHELSGEFRVISNVLDLTSCPNLQALAGGEIDEKE